MWYRFCISTAINTNKNIMRRTKSSPEVNAGSMADIAFLLLIFFLVTAAIPKNKGIYRKLPEKCVDGTCNTELKNRNVLKLTINSKNEIMVNDEIISLKDLKSKTKAFIDNNGDGNCTYCNGAKDKKLSENPNKAIISIKTDRNANYNQFIQVQDELTKAYFELRKAYSENILKKSIENLNAQELKDIKKAYPLILSEAEIE